MRHSPSVHRMTLYEMARLLIARKAPLTKEGFFNEESEVEALVDKMTALSKRARLSPFNASQ